MSTAQQNLVSVQAYLSALGDGDRARVSALLHDDAVEVIPLSPTGGQEPFAVLTGKDAVMGYTDSIVANFSQVRFSGEPEYTVGEGGDVVFFEGLGDLVARATDEPYRNVYVLKFVFREGRIARITEYANPVTFQKLMGQPVDVPASRSAGVLPA